MKKTNNATLHQEYVELCCDKCGKPTVYSHMLTWWQKFLQSFFHSEYGGKFVRHYHVHYCSDKNCNHRQLETQAYPRVESHIKYSPSEGRIIKSEHIEIN